MVKKLVFEMSGWYDAQDGYDHTSVDVAVELNHAIHDHLVCNKNNIAHHHKTRKWDKFKKLSNAYELVFTSTPGFPSIALHNPISRSYFKLWEMLHDFEDKIDLPSTPVTAVFLADAPGGFGEAFIDFRKKQLEQDKHDRLYAMSLKATNKIIPNWKFNHNYCKANNLTLFYGKSGSGCMYNIHNTNDLVRECGAHSAHFITADGGFDFSSDFNNQEDMSVRLVLCEVYAALRLQKEGGTFVLKIYDIHSPATMKLLYILKCFYATMHFVKPLSSRPANSEKYVVCVGFSHTQHAQQYEYVMNTLENNITKFIHSFLMRTFKVPMGFVYDVLRYNRIFIMSQSIHIIRTLDMIQKEKELVETDIIKDQMRKAIKWCHKYRTSISMEAIKQYKTLYFLEPSASRTGFT
jgi:FtsJ-like methyltransferase